MPPLHLDYAQHSYITFEGQLDEQQLPANVRLLGSLSEDLPDVQVIEIQGIPTSSAAHSHDVSELAARLRALGTEIRQVAIQTARQRVKRGVSEL